MSNSSFIIRKIITLSILSAIGTILMYLEIPSPIFWLKIDISDIVVYLSAMIYGPIGAIVVAFIKSLLNFFLKGSFVGVPIDQFIAFLASLAYALPLYYLTKLFNKKNNSTKARILPLILSSIIMTLFMTIVNFRLTDIYIRLMVTKDITKIGTVSHETVLGIVTDPGQYGLHFTLPQWIENSSWLPKDIWFWFIVITYIPFNLLKTTITSVLYFALSYRLDYVIKRFKISEPNQSIILQLSENE